ncbi:MAG: hypothetical protein R3E68_03270 [Burkholderiaceae bacterium]
MAAAGLHGPLMICGFFGVVIALERAVAIGRGWAYLGPLFAGSGTVALVSAQATFAAMLYLAGSTILLIATADVLRRQSALFTLTLVAGAACFAIGNALWLAGWSVHETVPWWLAFLILTIAGERLELSRLLPPSPVAKRVFAVLLAIILIGLAGGRTGWGSVLFAAGLLGLAGWLLKQDIARHTVRRQGLTRFIAVCLLSGYLWLALGSIVILVAGGLAPGTPSYDAALHALALGFVFSMVFGHAPIIFPAVLRVAVPYSPSFYLALVLLQVSLVVRLIGDATGQFDWLRAGGLLNAVSLIVFLLGTIVAVVRGQLAHHRPSRKSPGQTI